MRPEGKRWKPRVVVAAVSGGPDSVYLLLGKLAREKGTRIVLAHVNYGRRGADSEKDQKMVEDIGKSLGYKTEICVIDKGGTGRDAVRGSRRRLAFPSGFEEKARRIRYRFLRGLSAKEGASAIALAHTADDQVETILMRVFEGAGIGGLKGIPREAADGIVRPILDVWKEDILEYLKKRKIPYRIDRSNVDTRFERNWVRHVLIPLLEQRYGKAVKKRIFTLGERFRELDDYLELEASRWIKRNVKTLSQGKRRLGTHGKERGELSGRAVTSGYVFPRESFSALPSVLRVKILQRICFERIGVAPNERLLNAMDRNVSAGGPSARVNAGNGWELANRYEEALFVPGESGRGRKATGSALVEKPAGKVRIPDARKDKTLPPILFDTSGEYQNPGDLKGGSVKFVWEARGKITPVQAKRLASKGGVEVFDTDGLSLPLTVRPLRAGDRIRPFGGSAGGNARDGEKKVKEILIDRKVPRDERWGRPVVCDAGGAILWIPGVLRSDHAPVTPATRTTALLRIRLAK